MLKLVRMVQTLKNDKKQDHSLLLSYNQLDIDLKDQISFP